MSEMKDEVFMSDRNNKDREYVFRSMPPTQAVLTLAVPGILSQLVTLVYNLADTYFIGQTGDPVQVASVTMGTPLFMMLNAFAGLFGVGGGSQISRLMGAGKHDRARSVCSFSFYACIGCTAAYSLLILAFLRPLMKVLGASPQSLDFSMSYIIWTVVIGGIPTALSMMMAHLLRSEGLAQKSAFGIGLGGALNIVLDYIFIKWIFESAVMGAAFATMLSNTVVTIYFLVVMLRLKNTVLSIDIKDFTLEKNLILPVFQVGFAAAMQGLLINVSSVIVNKLAAAYGDVTVAALGIGKKIDRLPLCVGMGLSQGILPVVAYNFAAGNMERMRKVLRSAQVFGISIAVICIICFEIFAEQISTVFIPDPETVRICSLFVRLTVATTPIMILNNLYNTTFQAMGRAKESMMITICRRGLAYIPALFILDRLWQYTGIIIAQPISDLICIGLAIYFYRKMVYGHQNKNVSAKAETIESK